MHLLSVKNLWVRYASSDWILRDLSFNIGKGELVVFAGESGSGKSTLARTLTGFIPYFYPGEVRGEISVMGINPVEKGPEELFGLVGFLGQDPSLYTISTNVIGEIVYPMEIMGLDVDEMESRIRRATDFFSLKKIIKSSLIEVSSGELQRVALASIYGVNPEIFILDEPLARLDPITSKSISALLKEISEEGKTVIVFEHHLDEILPLSDRVIVLKNGVIVYDGEPRGSLRHLREIDLPEITELFMDLGVDDSKIPVTVSEGVELCEKNTV